MNCLKCGSNIITGDKFCRNCGTVVSQQENSSVVNSQIGMQNNMNQSVQPDMNNMNPNNQQISQYGNNPSGMNIGVQSNMNQFVQPDMNNMNPNNQQISQYGNNPSGVNVGVQNNMNQSVQASMNNMSPNNQVQTNYNQQIVNDEDLKRAYMGKSYDQIKQKKGLYLLWIFFFDSLYFIYRKMYLYGFLWFIGEIILTVFLPFFSVFILLGVRIFCMIKFYDIYDKHVTEKIKQIKNQNLNCNQSQLINICSKKGGTNIIVPILIPVISIVIILLILVPLIFGVVNTAKDQTSKTQAYDYISNVEKEITLNIIEDFDYESPTIITDVDMFDVDNKPDSVFLYLSSDGKVTSGTLTYGNTVFEYNNGMITEK